MKNVKKYCIPLALAALLAPALTACSLKDTMLMLYGGDGFVQEEKDPIYTLYEGENGVSVVYDSNAWIAPVMAQPDTISITAGGQMDYTAVLLQVTDTYTDFLAQSGAELEAEANTVQYELSFTVPGAAVTATRYDCGSYQTILAQLDYDSGATVYVTAATRVADNSVITDLLQNVYPTGQTPESAQSLLNP